LPEKQENYVHFTGILFQYKMVIINKLCCNFAEN
jgi:hypothetical protein